MNQFSDLEAIDNKHYRGSHGAASRATIALAVGPVRAVAEYIRDNALDVTPQLRNEVFACFRRSLTQPNGPVDAPGAPQGQVHAHAPGTTLAQRMDFLLQLPGVAADVFTSFEHVLFETEAQINTPRTARLLESVSRNPQVAILYAYGIDPGDWFDHQSVSFRDGSANQDAFVAVLPETRGLDDRTALQRVQNIAAPNGLTVDEARRRMTRDAEVLLTGTVPPDTIIDLPAFGEQVPQESLKDAATELIQRGVAWW